MTEEYRGYRVLPAPFTMYKVLNMGKGAVPVKLSGSFTTPKEAKLAIDQYLDLKGGKDAGTNSSE